MKTGRLQVYLLLIFFISTISCSNKIEVKSVCRSFLDKSIRLSGLTIDYPKKNTLFPVDFQSPTFRWTDEEVNHGDWFVCITDAQNNILIHDYVQDREWKPDSLQWEGLKQNHVEEKVYLTVIGYHSRQDNFTGDIQPFQISKDPVGADIFFRAVTLPFSFAVRNVQTIEWYMGSVRGEAPRKMLDNMPVCANCHSFSGNLPTLAMDVDYGNDKGSYALAGTKDTCNIRPEDIISWSSFKKDQEEPTFGLLSQISPSGKYVLSTVKDLSVFAAVDDNLAYSQLFFPIKGIIGIYDVESKRFSELLGANDPDFVQSNPVWSPDNKTVLFARTEAYINEKVKRAGTALLDIEDVKEFKSGGKEFKFDIFSVDFNDGKGGEPKPLGDASNNGKSNYFPKYSPDGRWIVFCQAENFMLLQPDSKLYIMKSDGTEARLMNCNQTGMNSWHSWSPNGHWLVFSSKNESLYTRLYITHIDENGNDSPPVLLENLVFEQRAANIPEFYPGEASEFKNIKDDFSNTAAYYARLATDNIKSQYYLRAGKNLNLAMSLDPKYIDTYILKILLNSILQQVNSAAEQAEKIQALAIVDSLLNVNKADDELLFLQASLLSAKGDQERAMTILNAIISRTPTSYKAYELLASLYKKQNKPDQAIRAYRKMIALAPSNDLEINQFIALLYLSNNKLDDALTILQNLSGKYPWNEEIHENLFTIYQRKQDLRAARKEIQLLHEYDSENYRYYLMEADLAELEGQKVKAAELSGRGISLLQLKLQQNGENIPLYFELADMLQRNQDLKGAAECYDAVLKTLPSNYKALKEKARLMLKMQQWQEAIGLYDKLLTHYDPEEEFYNNTGIALIKTGNYEEALHFFNNTLRLNPSDPDAIHNRNRLYQLLGKS